MNSILKNDTTASIKDSIFYSLMVGMGENFLCAFMLAMGVGDVWAGLISVVPILMGSFLQLYSSYGLKYCGSYRKWVVICVFLQAFSFIPLLVVANKGSAPLWLIFAFVAFYWATGMAASTAWNVWISNLIPDTKKKGFFSTRGLFSQSFTLLGLALGGVALQWGEKQGFHLQVFTVLFFVAFAFRLVSAFYLTKQSEMIVAPEFSPKLGFREFFQELTKGKASGLFRFMLFFYLCVHFSAPYFAPFMLSQLHLNYHAYMVLIACAYVTKSLAYHLLGTWLRRIPNHVLLLISATGVVTLPWLWTLNTGFFYLCVIQMLSGFVWAIYELATFLLIIELIPDIKRSVVLAFYNVFNYSMILIGAAAGGLFLSLNGKSMASYLDLFYYSSALRLVALIFLPAFYFSYRKQMRQVELN